MGCCGCGWDTSEDSGGGGGTADLSLSELNNPNVAYLVDREGKFSLDNLGRYIIFEAEEKGYSFFDVDDQTLLLAACEATERIQVVGLSLTTNDICEVEFLSNLTPKYKYYSGGNGHGIALSDEQDLWTGGWGESLGMAVTGAGAVSGRVAIRIKSW